MNVEKIEGTIEAYTAFETVRPEVNLIEFYYSEAGGVWIEKRHNQELKKS